MSDKKDDNSVDLGENGIHLFSGDVDEENCFDAIRFVLECNLDKSNKFDFLTLIVNSPGGYVKDGFALIDVMSGSKMPVRTTGIGMLASMGLLIFIAGQKEYRTLTPNTLIMSHQWTGAFWGKEHELIAAQKELKVLQDMVMRHYKKHTGLKEKDIKKYLLPANDVWLTAKEAKKLNLCDVVKDV